MNCSIKATAPPKILMHLSIGFFIMLALLLGAISTAAAASFRTDVYVEFTYGSNQVQRIYAYEKSKICYLFLPSGIAADTMRLFFPQETLYFEGTAIQSGEAAAILVPDSTIALQNQKGNKALTLSIMQGNGIPSAFVQTQSGSVKALERSKSNTETGHLALFTLDGSLDADASIEKVRGHGNSTFSTSFPKRSYQIRLAKRTDLLGMGKAKAYVLLAEWLDLSQLRSRISMDMARQAGVSSALDCTSVNLYLNGCYHGTYLLAEKVGINANRVDIYDLEKATEKVNDLPLADYQPIREIDKQYQQYYASDIPNDPADITGGYILELIGSSRFNRKDSGFITSNDMCVTITEPTHTTMAQTRYIGEIFDRFNRAILNKNGTDPVSGERYDALFDSTSLAKVLVLLQISKNYDHEKNSLYFYKDSDTVDTKVYAGPVWDFDRSYGNVNTGYWVNSPTIDLYRTSTKTWYLYGNLYNNQSDFALLVKQVYQSSYRPALEILLGLRTPGDASPLRSLDAYYEELAPSAAMNFTRWNPFAVTAIYKHSGRTFEASVKNLKIFLQMRMDALNVTYALDAG